MATHRYPQERIPAVPANPQKERREEPAGDGPDGSQCDDDKDEK